MDLAQKIAAYQPNGGVRQLVADTKLVLLVGISGAGKDTTKQRLLQDPEFADIVSYTTRPPRPGRPRPLVEVPTIHSRLFAFHATGIQPYALGHSEGPLSRPLGMAPVTPLPLHCDRLQTGAPRQLNGDLMFPTRRAVGAALAGLATLGMAGTAMADPTPVPAADPAYSIPAAIPVQAMSKNFAPASV